MDIDKVIELLMVSGKLDDTFDYFEDDKENENVVIDNSLKIIKRKDKED